MRPAKTQISLGIRPVWTELSLCAQWVAKDPIFLHADSKDFDQTARMCRLICAFVVRIWYKQVFLWCGSYVWRKLSINFHQISSICFRGWMTMSMNFCNSPKLLALITFGSTPYATSCRRFFAYHHTVKHTHTSIILSWFSIPFVLKCAIKFWKLVYK